MPLAKPGNVCQKRGCAKIHPEKKCHCLLAHTRKSRARPVLRHHPDLVQTVRGAEFRSTPDAVDDNGGWTIAQGGFAENWGGADSPASSGHGFFIRVSENAVCRAQAEPIASRSGGRSWAGDEVARAAPGRSARQPRL